eukprot:930830-Rhodomonas_salina.1
MAPGPKGTLCGGRRGAPRPSVQDGGVGEKGLSDTELGGHASHDERAGHDTQPGRAPVRIIPGTPAGSTSRVDGRGEGDAASEQLGVTPGYPAGRHGVMVVNLC